MARDIARINAVDLLALFIICTAIAAVAFVGQKHSFIPCYADCGETFVALHQARNFDLQGFKYGLVEDHATSPDPAAHPYAYTHNVNIAAVIFPLLQAIGVTSVTGKQVITLLAFGVGLCYFYFLIARQAESRVAGLVVLLFFGIEYQHVLAWGLAALRAWHWLALFGVLYHALELVQEPDRRPILNKILLLVFLSVAFSMGYDFMAITMATAVIAMLLNGRKGMWRQLVLFAVLALIPFALRQIQIISVMGWVYWAVDIKLSLLIKVPWVAKLFKSPPMEAIEAWYQSYNVLRPYAAPTQSLSELWAYALRYVRGWTIPSTGFLSFALMCSVVAVVVATVGIDIARRLWRAISSLAPDRTWGLTRWRWEAATLALLAVLAVVAIHPGLRMAGIIIICAGLWLGAVSMAIARIRGERLETTLARSAIATLLRSTLPTSRQEAGSWMMISAVAFPILVVYYWYYRPMGGWPAFFLGNSGIGTALIVALGVAAASLVALLIRRTDVTLLARPVADLSRGTKQVVCLLFSLSVGILIGMSVFMPLSLIFYLKHQFPLLAAPLALSKGMVIVCLGRSVRNVRPVGTFVGTIAAIALIGAEHASVQINNYKTRTEMDVSWIPEIRDRADASFAVSWIAPSVAAFSRNWVVGITPGRQDAVLKRMRERQPPFIESDLFYFGEKDRKARIKEYLQPDYWLYFRIYYEEPTGCYRTDWLSVMVRTAFRTYFYPVSPPVVSTRVTHSGALGVGPGGWIRLSGGLAGNTEAYHSVDLVRGFLVSAEMPEADIAERARSTIFDPTAGPADWDCPTGAYSANLQVPSSLPLPSTGKYLYVVPIRATYNDGRSFIIDSIRIPVIPDGPAPAQSRPPRSRLPTVEQIIDENPELAIAAKGRDFILVDMRKHYSK